MLSQLCRNIFAFVFKADIVETDMGLRLAGDGNDGDDDDGDEKTTTMIKMTMIKTMMMTTMKMTMMMTVVEY